MNRIVLAALFACLVLLPAGQAGVIPQPAPLLQSIPTPDWEELGLVQEQHTPVPEASSGIGPGSLLLITIPDEGTFLCTANFVWTAGGKTYLGAAGHCFLPDGSGQTHGPGAHYDASGVVVRVCVDLCRFGGEVSFSSPGTMRALGAVTYARANGVGKDFGIVEIPTARLGDVRPSMPVWGGPTTATPDTTIARTPLCHYGNGIIVAETLATKGRTGLGETVSGDSWDAFLTAEGGDSGSAVITCDTHTNGVHGIAPVGILTHGIGIASVGVPVLAFGTTVAKAKSMATEAGLSLTLVTGP